MIKLHEKNQSPTMQEEAAKAVRIYYEMLETTPHLPPLHTPLTRGEREGLRGEGTIKVEDSANFTTPPDPLFTKEGVTKSGEFSLLEWQNVHDGLFAEIKVRHYSQKTLRSYSIWIKKFQQFTKNKLPKELNSQDVKDFIRHLAVDCRVSASSQNQAFKTPFFFCTDTY